jgi:hypothetical protein
MPNVREPIDQLAAFIANAPLYSWLELGQLWEDVGGLPSPARLLDVPVVYRYCSHPKCKTERPFHRIPNLFGQVSNVFSLAFMCTGCNEREFHCWVETAHDYYKSETKRIRKIGQTPPWDISIPPALQEAFGEDAGLYKSARVCMSQAYGIATCAYLRRILENRITPLLKTLREIRKQEGSDEAELRKIDEAMQGRTAEERIRLANQALPASIKIGGVNPLALIYERLSDALHRRDEQECMDVAQKTMRLLEYVVTNLTEARRHQQERTAYEEDIRTLRQGPAARAAEG